MKKSPLQKQITCKYIGTQMFLDTQFRILQISLNRTAKNSLNDLYTINYVYVELE